MCLLHFRRAHQEQVAETVFASNLYGDVTPPTTPKSDVVMTVVKHV